MTLKTYHTKRRFERTPEPKGKSQAGRGGLRFVVQKHQATRLHYDFRLELDGVLKSWAVPKGPSLNPAEKRLAVMVEDHPLEYRTFEGTIPEGNYGAGTVMVWDAGTYEPLDAADRTDNERKLRDELEKGHLHFILHGHKLRGEFSLVKLKRGKGNEWLLFKHRDQFAGEADVRDGDRSALSRRTLEGIARTDNQPGQATRHAKIHGNGRPNGHVKSDVPHRAGKSTMPHRIKPMLATLVDEPFDRPGWLFKVNFTNLDKVFWPDEGYTKGDVLRHYHAVAPLILPYLRHRPLVLLRHPNGIGGKSFFQKDVTRQPPPEGVQTADIVSESEKKKLKYIVGQDEATLLYLANLGCIEMNPWNSRVGALDKPDYLIIDLDPGDVPFSQAVETAQAVRKILEERCAECYCKTSGKRGLHVYLPLAARYDYDQVRQFAKIIARLVHEQLPETTSLARSPAQRRNKVYLDYLQNSRGQTIAAPYSLRPVAGATVSTPLAWNEVNGKLDPKRFTIDTIQRRLDKVGDLWKPILGKGIDLAKCLKSLQE